MTTEEEIAILEGWATSCINDDGSTTADVLCAIAYELRALRLMLREEIREAAWRLGDRAMTDEQAGAIIRAMGEPRPYDQDNPIASRKAPEA